MPLLSPLILCPGIPPLLSDILQFLPFLYHDISPLLSLLYVFGVRFRVFLGLCTFWRTLVILELLLVHDCTYALEV